MSRYLLVAAVVVGFSVPAIAAKGYHPLRRGYHPCKIVNVAPYYNKTTIRKGRRVYVTREIARQDMAIICRD
jgi:hypothetical protein